MTEHQQLRENLGVALATARTATLSVLEAGSGTPYGALVNVAATPGGTVVTLLSRLAKHTQGLLADPRASLLVTGSLPETGDVLTGFRATLMGRMVVSDDPVLRDTFLTRHPYAEGYAGFADFSFWVMQPTTVHAVGGFGRITTVAASELFPLA